MSSNCWSELCIQNLEAIFQWIGPIGMGNWTHWDVTRCHGGKKCRVWEAPSREMLVVGGKFGLFVHKMRNKLWKKLGTFLKNIFFPALQDTVKQATSHSISNDFLIPYPFHHQHSNYIERKSPRQSCFNLHPRMYRHAN